MSAGKSDRTMFGDWWLEAFGDKPAHLRFVLEMARYVDDKTGELSVSVLTIAKRMGVDERHAWRYRAAAIKAGVITEIGRTGRTKRHRMNYSKPGDSCHGNDRQGSYQTLATNDANPGNEAHRTLATVVDANGNLTGSYNGAHAEHSSAGNEDGGKADLVAKLIALGVESKRLLEGCDTSYLRSWAGIDPKKFRGDHLGAFIAKKIRLREEPPTDLVAKTVYAGLQRPVSNSGNCERCGQYETLRSGPHNGRWCADCVRGEIVHLERAQMEDPKVA